MRPGVGCVQGRAHGRHGIEGQGGSWHRWAPVLYRRVELSWLAAVGVPPCRGTARAGVGVRLPLPAWSCAVAVGGTVSRPTPGSTVQKSSVERPFPDGCTSTIITAPLRARRQGTGQSTDQPSWTSHLICREVCQEGKVRRRRGATPTAPRCFALESCVVSVSTIRRAVRLIYAGWLPQDGISAGSHPHL